MKNLLFTISIFLIQLISSISINAQEMIISDQVAFSEKASRYESTKKIESGYKSFLSDSRIQKMVFCVFDGSTEITYAKSGTETINGVEYVKFKPDFQIGNVPYDLFLREDTLIGKLWSLNGLTNEEWLTINMSMNLGDTLILSSRYANYYDTIAIVDSIFLDDHGAKHILLNLSCFNFALNPQFNNLEFIEGIGSNFGLGYQTIDPIDDLYQEILLCTYHNQDKIYSHPSAAGDSCQILFDALEHTSMKDIKIWPNPASTGINISKVNTNNNSWNLLIHDCTGKVVYTEVIEGQTKEIFIPLSRYPNGVYLIEIRQEDHLIIHLKILIVK